MAIGNILYSTTAGNIAVGDKIQASDFEKNTSLQFDDATGNLNAANINVSGNLHAQGNSILGSNANVIITGGAAGQTLVTDGAGDLSWATMISVAGANTQVQYNNAGAMGADSSFTFDNTTDTVTVDKLKVNSLANLGANTNVIITGSTTAGELLVSNGASGVNWAYTDRLVRGTSNVLIDAVNGNILIGANGQSNVITIASTGAVATTNISNALNVSGTAVFAANANVTGNLNVTANANITGNLHALGNSILGSNANVIITGGTNGQVLTTDGTGILSWSSAGGGGGGGFQNFQLFDTTGTNFTVPAGITKLRVTVIGGGGGGFNDAGGPGDIYYPGVAAMGTALVTVTPGQVIPVTIGAGGNGGRSGAPATTGGTTSFGTFISAGGGGAAFVPFFAVNGANGVVSYGAGAVAYWGGPNIRGTNGSNNGTSGGGISGGGAGMSGGGGSSGTLTSETTGGSPSAYGGTAGQNGTVATQGAGGGTAGGSVSAPYGGGGGGTGGCIVEW